MVRQINKIVVHCSDSPDGRDDRMMDIDRWHKERGFGGVPVASGGKTRLVYCGYHFVICIDGTVEIGRPESAVGAHVKGHNAKSIGVCWIGRKKIGVDQRDALLTILNSLMNKYGLMPTAIFGHKELDPGKTCPNLDMSDLRGDLEILNKVGA